MIMSLVEIRGILEMLELATLSSALDYTVLYCSSCVVSKRQFLLDKSSCDS